jgi:hypothetical protein
MLLGDAILVPITEVGSVACALGSSAACAACLALARRTNSNRIALSLAERGMALFALLVGIAMALMKILPAVPGHFTIYEWIALAVWIAWGAVSHRSAIVLGGGISER